MSFCSTILPPFSFQSHWLTVPLSSVGELFPLISPHEVSLLLIAVNTHISQTTPFKSDSPNQPTKKEHLSVIKSVLVNNIQHFGGLYGRYMKQEAASVGDRTD